MKDYIPRDNRRLSFVCLMLWTQAILGVLIACCFGAWEDFVALFELKYHEVNGVKYTTGFIPWIHFHWINRLGNCSLPYIALCLWIAHSEYVIRFGGVLRRVRLRWKGWE